MNKHLAQIHSIPVTTVHQPVYLKAVLPAAQDRKYRCRPCRRPLTYWVQQDTTKHHSHTARHNIHPTAILPSHQTYVYREHNTITVAGHHRRNPCCHAKPGVVSTKLLTMSYSRQTILSRLSLWIALSIVHTGKLT